MSRLLRELQGAPPTEEMEKQYKQGSVFAETLEGCSNWELNTILRMCALELEYRVTPGSYLLNELVVRGDIDEVADYLYMTIPNSTMCGTDILAQTLIDMETRGESIFHKVP